jgi:hypothetical protein
MSGSNLVPPVASTSNGTLAVVLNAKSPAADSSVTFNITTNSLSGEPSSILFHAAAKGANTDSFLFDAKPFFDPETGIAVGRFPKSLLTADTFRLLIGGGVYANVRTTIFPKGEIRAQVSLSTPTVDAVCDAAQPTTCNVPAWWTRCAGLTGILVSVVMVVMFPVAADSVRPLKYEFFFTAHHLFVLFYLFLGFHGPNFWKWTCGPVIMYCIERAYRYTACQRRPPFSHALKLQQILPLPLPLQDHDGQGHLRLILSGAAFVRSCRGRLLLLTSSRPAAGHGLVPRPRGFPVQGWTILLFELPGASWNGAGMAPLYHFVKPIRGPPQRAHLHHARRLLDSNAARQNQPGQREGRQV